RQMCIRDRVQRIFAEKERIGIAPKGVLADFLSVDERAEKAVESLFGPFLQTVLVENVEEARTVSSWLSSNRVGRVSVLIAPGIGPAGTGGESVEMPGCVAEALGASPALLEILHRAFPREMSARIVETIDDLAIGSADETCVGTNGDILIGGSLFTSGQQDSGEKNSSLLAFKRELSGLEKSVTKLDRGVADAEQKVAGDRQRLAEIEEKTVDLQSVIIKVERHLLSLEMQEKTARQEIERAERHRKVVVDEAQQIAAEIDEVRNRIKEAFQNRETAEERRAAAREGLDEIAAKLAAAREKADAENAVLNEKRTLAATSGERRRSVQAALRRVENEQKELEARMISLKGELSGTETKIAELKALVTQIAGKIAGVDSDLDAEQKQLADAMEKLAAARATADASSEDLAELNRKAAEAMNERAAIEVRQAEAVTELKNANENCAQELNIALKELVETEQIADDFVLEDARQRVDDLRQRLESFGAINMLAVEELAEAEERLLFLTSQRQDIIESIASAEEALREIKERSRERFKHAFEAINENFKQYFGELFGGGRGEMTLLESEDILEAGIEVVAQPPGKRLQNILLLSGGEKAMTAIALVLAIFKYRPSPFCLLDEVDAPLDDANVGRFVTKIAEMSEKTQFIVITHNKRTMEAARALYGVTMQEAGVSKVVSVKFE
ncbi:MAG: hypothetical protein QUS14_14820, partial [Pyrinomonadaceae bacterium]|nr:hypothetical protein [Pyrinomonadaceae bacterium]